MAFFTLASPAPKAHADDLTDLSLRLIEDPLNTELNLRYASEAERKGKPRLALAAYERILLNDPRNKEARYRYARLRRLIQPPSTVIRATIGQRWDTSPYNISELKHTDSETFFTGSIVDERLFLGRRWRSSVALEQEIWRDHHDLDYGYAGVNIGPMFEMGPRLTLLPSVGASIATLDDDYYYHEFNATLTAEGRVNGLSPWGRLRVGFRDFRSGLAVTDGYYAEAMGGVTVPRLAFGRDRLSASGWLRASDIKGSIMRTLNEEISPGKYDEYGVELNYSFDVSSFVTLGLGVLARERFYQESDVGDENRRDFYVAPEVSASVNRLLPCNCTLRVSYRRRENISNDSYYDYGADQSTAALITRF